MGLLFACKLPVGKGSEKRAGEAELQKNVAELRAVTLGVPRAKWALVRN